MGKVGHARSPAQIERDRRVISQMYLQGSLQIEIADQLGLSVATVSNDLRKLQQFWWEASLQAIDEIKSRELAKIDILELEYWNAWKRSQLNTEQSTTEDLGSMEFKDLLTGEITERKRVKTIKKSEGQSGNPSFLEGVLKCINKRCEILGIDSPNKNINFNFDLSKLSIEQLDRLSAGENIVSVLTAPGQSRD
jgi:hypothetical protein